MKKLVIFLGIVLVTLCRMNIYALNIGMYSNFNENSETFDMQENLNENDKEDDVVLTLTLILFILLMLLCQIFVYFNMIKLNKEIDELNEKVKSCIKYSEEKKAEFEKLNRVSN